MKLKFSQVLILSLVLSFAPALVLANDVQVTASLDKRAARVNEELNLTIKVIGAQGNIQAPRVPGIDGMDLFYTGRSSHFTFANNQSTSSIEFSYVLVPRKEGQFTLNPIAVSVGTNTYTTQAMTLSVSGTQPKPTYTPPQTPKPVSAPQPGAPSRAPVQAPTPSLAGEDENIFVQAWVDKKTAFPNEQVLLTYSLYTRYDTRYEGFEEEPEVSGFWIEEFPQERDVHRETVRVNGLQYIKADIKKVALFPTAAADYTIYPGAIKVSIRQEPKNRSVFDEFFSDSFFSGGSFFSRRENRLLKPKPIEVTVRPFPEYNKPADFQGAVGQYQLEATVDKNQIKQNEPITMTLTIHGEGNIETLNRPTIPDMPNVKVYDSDTSSQLFKQGDTIGGKKTFETVFIPREAGEFVIPQLEFHYFNPRSQTYQTLKTREFRLNVEKGEDDFQIPDSISQQDVFKKEVRVEGKDIRFIHELMPSESGPANIRTSILSLAVANGVLMLLFLLGLWRNAHETKYAKDTGLRRKKFAKQNAQAGIRKIKKLARSKNPEDLGRYFEEVDKTLTQYLCDKYDYSAQGITRGMLEDQLTASLGAEDPLLKEIQELYSICDMSRFARASVEQEQKNRAMTILKHTIARIERVRK